jgi:hypothetical protein|tara:strand:- start:307 stop:576 length:270 start_codon:yes stop_codon:yes gene_type:complete
MILSREQRNELTEQFVEIVVDNMSEESLVLYAQEMMTENCDHLMQQELKEMVLLYDETLWDELVENVQSTTYGLEVGESITFPVHNPDS